MEARIAFLKREADQEGGLFSKASESDFRRFVESHSAWSKPSLYLVDNGNLRAVWKSALGLHLGLQFLGGAEVQFVIFARDPDESELVRSAGRDSLIGIESRIASFEFDDQQVAGHHRVGAT
jgi:hypothetical protein